MTIKLGKVKQEDDGSDFNSATSSDLDNSEKSSDSDNDLLQEMETHELTKLNCEISQDMIDQFSEESKGEVHQEYDNFE